MCWEISGQDYGKRKENMFVFLVLTYGLLLIWRFDRDFAKKSLLPLLIKRGAKALRAVKALCGINALAIACFVRKQQGGLMQKGADHVLTEAAFGMTVYFLLCLFAGCLLLACVTDAAAFLVHRIVWWPAAVAGVLLLAVNSGKIIGLIIFCAMQQLLFVRLYGRADCHAFCVCALVQCAFGMSLLAFLIHMLATFGLLATVQAARRNINGRGNLKTPVAFLPYITFAFWIILLL